MNFEEYMKELEPTINLLLNKFNIKTEKEDLYQEAIILIWELYEQGRLDKQNYKAYYYGALKNKLNNILLDEHKQGLWITTHQIEFENEYSNIDNIIIDEYLEKLRLRRNELQNKRYKDNPEYRQMKKDRVAEWQKNNKEKHNYNNKKYKEKNREKLRKKSLDYYYKHREEILEKRRLKKIKENTKNSNNK